jgi:polar amino acid transport system permease protein
MELLFVVALWYLVATSVASVLQYYVERHYGRSERNQRTSAADRVLSRAFSRLRGQSA